VGGDREEVWHFEKCWTSRALGLSSVYKIWRLRPDVQRLFSGERIF
jgi:hypothetical protein